MLGRLDLPFRFRVRAAHALTSFRIAHHSHAVPNTLAVVEVVPKYAIAARGIPGQHRRAPDTAPRCRNTLCVQSSDNLARRGATDVFVENPADDFGLAFDDRQLAWLAGHGYVTIGPAPGAAPVTHHAGKPAPGLFFQLVEKHLAEQALDADGQRVGLPPVHFEHSDPHEVERLEQRVKVGRVSANTVQRLHHDHVENPFLGVCNQGQEAVPTE
nr:hypothetical protein [Maritimibacter alkaliphilus]